ncbi:hypothetical protein PM082_014997 [Marasmius tenuissimus]|nr:hypothetical protein PM082_014997 [Marasmius tenuissimus]
MAIDGAELRELSGSVVVTVAGGRLHRLGDSTGRCENGDDDDKPKGNGIWGSELEYGTDLSVSIGPPLNMSFSSFGDPPGSPGCSRTHPRTSEHPKGEETPTSMNHPTPSFPATQRTKEANLGIIIGSILGVFAALFLVAVAWRFRQRKKGQISMDTERMPSNSNKAHPVTPYLLPEVFQVREKRTRLRMKRDSFMRTPHPVESCEASSGRFENRDNAITLRNDDNDQAVRTPPTVPAHARWWDRPTSTTQSSIIPAIHWIGEEGGTAMGQIITPPATTDINLIVGRHGQIDLDPVKGPIFQHTDSGWRLAFGRTVSECQSSGSGSGGELVMPPTYSEAN